MIRILFTIILIVHGLIHLIGFFKEFQLGRTSLTGKTLIVFDGSTARIAGMLWLFSCLLFIFSAVVFLQRKESWWIIGAIAVILSQLLIIVYWKDTKFGTTVNVLILAAIILSYGSWKFNKMEENELKMFLSKVNPSSTKVTKEIMAAKPAIVQKWLERSQVIGKDIIYTAHLKQRGEMRTAQDSIWMKVKSEQYFRSAEPGFLWFAEVDGGPFIKLKGRDKYEDGKGQMLIKLFSLFPITNSKGKEIDQGTMLRYLAEMVWLPTSALEDYIVWEEIDPLHAKATMSYKGVTASGVYTFTNSGDVISFEAQRYYDRQEGPTLETWFISMEENGYKEFEGIRIPAKSSVTWKLKTGDFTWYILEIVDVEYNP